MMTMQNGLNATDEDDQMHQKLNDNIKPRVHLYLVQLINDLAREDDRWSQIKTKIRLDESLDKIQQK
jgi:hypothetical protein